MRTVPSHGVRVTGRVPRTHLSSGLADGSSPSPRATPLGRRLTLLTRTQARPQGAGTPDGKRMERNEPQCGARPTSGRFPVASPLFEHDTFERGQG